MICVVLRNSKARYLEMKKRLLAMFLVVALTAVSVVACGKSKDKASSKKEDGDENIEEESETYHFTIWGNEGDFSKEKENWLKTRCDMFVAKYPNDEVIFDFASYSTEEAVKKMAEDRENAPDIFIFDSSQINELVENRLLTRLWGKTEEYVLSSNTTSIANLATYQGKVYGIPVSANPYVLYYDKRVLTEEDVKQLDTILAKGVLSYSFDDERYLKAFYEAQDVVEIPEEESTEEEDSKVREDSEAADSADAKDEKEEQTAEATEGSKEEQTAENAEDSQEEQVSEPLAVEIVDTWLEEFKAQPNVVNDTDGTVGIAGFQSGTVQAAVYDTQAYQQIKDILGDNLGVAALPVFVIDGVEKQMKCVTDTKNIGVNPDCENFEMTIALATYLGSADSQQMHYDMSGVIPVNLTAVQTLLDLDLTKVIAQIADKENPGWDIPETEEEDD